MADTIKKYVSLENLGLYDEKIKTLIDSKDADILASANAYADGLADNYEAAGTVNTAKQELQGKIDTVSAANEATQAEVDALETLVGTLPSGTSATTVVGYVDAKTAGIATDAALTELNNQFTALKEDVQTIEADYLKDSDKTALQSSIEAVDNAVSTISADYLKSTDKTELEGKINAKADQTALDAEVSARETAVSGLQNQINTIMSNPDAEGAINSINEFTQYVADHGTIADGMRTDINKNKDDISAMDTAYKAADTELSGRLDILEAINHDAYVAADTALKNELTTEIGKKADSSALTSAVQALEVKDTELSGKISALEAKFGDGDGSVSDLISNAMDAEEARVDGLLANKVDKVEGKGLSTNDLTNELKGQYDAAYAHSQVAHAPADAQANIIESIKVNGTALTITGKAVDISVPVDNAELTNGAGYLVANDIAGKAEQTALQGEVTRATAAEEALGARIDEFVECTTADIEGLFAQTA